MTTQPPIRPGETPDTPDTPDYEHLWQDGPAGQLLLDDDGLITATNVTFTAWTGHDGDALRGTSFTRLLPIGDRILYSTHCVPQLMVTGRVSEASVQILGADGTRHPALLSATRTAAEGRAAGVSIVVVDARQRRLYEAQLLEQRREAEDARARLALEEARLQELIHRDALTGLLNRPGLLRALRASLVSTRPASPDTPGGGIGAWSQRPGARSQERTAWHQAPAPARSAACPTIFFVDLDGFKTVNDDLGHASGDELLQVVAHRLQASWRAGAAVARLAGDEFVLLDVLDPAHVHFSATRLLDVLAQPVLLQGVEVVVSASIGVAAHEAEPSSASAGRTSFAGQSTEDLAELLLRRADVAMYRAKSTGRPGWSVHRTGDPDPSADRLVLLEELRSALRRGELRVHYQPRIDARTGRIRGVEALVRWQHPERGLLAPVHFIDAAEESGLIRDLGRWVLQEAVEQVTRWDETGAPEHLQVSVNVSARQLADPHFPGQVATILARAGLRASRLVLEITETALMNDPDTALATLGRLKDLGVALAVDDFGTGYSSFTYLKQFPVDELKIDRSFVTGLDDVTDHDDGAEDGSGESTIKDAGGAQAAEGANVRTSARDAGDVAIVASCIHLAHAMGLVAVAEGVETRAQHRRLTSMGCDQLQGYLFSRPVPPELLRFPGPGGASPREGAGPR